MATKTKHPIVIDKPLAKLSIDKRFSIIDTLFASKKIILLFSQELVDEFIEVAQRRKFRKYFSVTDLEDLLIKVRARAEFIQVASIIDLCRDPKDNFLLALAQDGKATYLITGDQDLLILRKIGKTKIITMTEYND